MERKRGLEGGQGWLLQRLIARGSEGEKEEHTGQTENEHGEGEERHLGRPNGASGEGD